MPEGVAIPLPLAPGIELPQFFIIHILRFTVSNQKRDKYIDNLRFMCLSFIYSSELP